MRKLLVLLAVARVAAAEPFGEYGEAVYLRTPEQIKAEPCEVALRFDGAVVDGWLRERLRNTGDVPMGAVEEVTLPTGAMLIGAKLDADSAVAIPASFSAEPATDAVAADPLLVTEVEGGAHPRERMIVAPFSKTVTVQLHFTALAEIHDGALRLALPGWNCQRSVTVKPLAGATLIREHDTPTEVIAELAYGKPLVWTQTQPLGDGYTARLVTKLAPLAKAHDIHHVVVLIDGSRSMELVGAPAVTQVLQAIAAAVPKEAEVQGVIFDRKPGEVAKGFDAIEAAYKAHVPANGSDLAPALALAHDLIAGDKDGATVIAITDGAFGDAAALSFTTALGVHFGKAELHAIVLDRGELTAQSREAMRTAIDDISGSYVEVSADELDRALTDIDTWLRPAVAVGGDMLYAGTGTTDLAVVHAKVLGPTAPIAEHALFDADADDSIDEKVRAGWHQKHPSSDDDVAFSVLATKGTVARARHAAVAGGGPFTRLVTTPDPPFTPEVHVAQAHVVGPSALDKQLIDTLLRLQLQPAAYVCFQKALGQHPKLGGLVGFHLEISRGEVTRASVDGLGDPQFDACLVDAAYRVVPPMPDPSYNTDDRSLVSYPLTFQLHADKPVIVAGDADSKTPLDIDAIVGGPPRHVDAGDTSQPLGGMRSTLQPRP